MKRVALLLILGVRLILLRHDISLFFLLKKTKKRLYCSGTLSAQVFLHKVFCRGLRTLGAPISDSGIQRVFMVLYGRIS